MDSREIRARFLKFFEKRGHAIIPSSPLVPENDPSVLFNTAGMQPLVPYLMGTPHPSGKRLANSQKCVRTQDIEEVGDKTHDTFFEMLGNWSLGDYFKEDAIKWSFEFLTSKEEGLGLDPARLYMTVFEGNDDAPRDEEALEIWKKYMPENRIYFMSAKSNWWSPGDNGPCGPDTEMFYDVTERGLGDMTKEEYMAADDRQEVVEIWNDVFMEYEKKDGKVIGKLAMKNVDTGSGLERIVMAIQGKDNVFDTDLFAPIMEKIAQLAAIEIKDLRAQRIVADHIRTSVMMIADGVRPSNTDQGYILRRLIRRAVRYADVLGIGKGMLSELVPVIAEKYKGIYDNVAEAEGTIVKEIWEEEEKFRKTLERGTKELTTLLARGSVSGVDAFTLFSTYGFPIEMTEELAAEQGVTVDRASFDAEMKKHQELSRAGAEQKFKGGLADSSDKTTALHTATHLMLAGLRKYLGDGVHQAGSNITEERLRFDFTYPQKVERDVLDKVEAYVNDAIAKGCVVDKAQMKKEEAKAMGVEGSFWEKYPEEVTVYTVKDGGEIYSQELCGGPHVESTGAMGRFKIVKEEASSSGVRRIKAILE
ncbi:MAG: alanine--tRNA ligase [Candidatus Pacebacteria bacterium]|jgi:alanyl-tRNA synthetase|nr:alanine--tRNA ligase [Candidatus Paceibacterota bacterium]